MTSSQAKIWFTSDLHFYHKKILEYCPNRDFLNVEEHNSAIIRDWCRKVKHNDEVWVLGDFSFGNVNQTEELLRMLPGRIHMLPGNHDSNWFKKLKNKGTLERVEFHPWLINRGFNKKRYYLCHYPLEEWAGSRKGKKLHFHGHTHNNGRIIHNRIDVGWDLHNGLISLERLLEKLKEQNNRIQ